MANVVEIRALRYKAVAAGQTDTALVGDTTMGAAGTGAKFDILDGVLIIPAVAACGAVSIKDGSGSAITLFVGGGVTALPSCIPFMVPLGIRSASGAWSVTTGANVSVIAVGRFT